MKCFVVLALCALLVATTYAQSHECAKGCVAEASNGDSWCNSECNHCNGHISCDTNLDACICTEDNQHPPHNPDNNHPDNNHPDNHHPVG